MRVALPASHSFGWLLEAWFLLAEIMASRRVQKPSVLILSSRLSTSITFSLLAARITPAGHRDSPKLASTATMSNRCTRERNGDEFMRLSFEKGGAGTWPQWSGRHGIQFVSENENRFLAAKVIRASSTRQVGCHKRFCRLSVRPA